MTLVDLARHFEKSRWSMARALESAGHRIGKDLVEHAQAKFGEDQGAVGPYPEWAPLADSTITEKARLGYDTPFPLIREGDLKNSISYQVDRQAATVVVYLFSTDWKMPLHEYGSPAANLPARPVLGPTVYERREAYTQEVEQEINLAIQVP